MEIRNALQKIENYLTVVSNLNRTILSEGTMSRDELLLMKKYLYTSIDRIEDIERLLVIDSKDEKSFDPSETPVLPYVQPQSKEIVQVQPTENIEAKEAALTNIEEPEMVNELPEIQTGIEADEMEIAGMIMPHAELPEMEEEENAPVAENSPEETSTISTGIEIVPMIQSIITEDLSYDELKEPETETPETPLVSEVRTEASPIVPLAHLLSQEEETLAERFSENKPATFLEEMMSKKKEEVSLFEHLNQKMNNTPAQPQLFELFNEEKEEEISPAGPVFSNDSPAFDHEHTSYSGSVLVAEKVAAPVVEKLTPSSLNDVFRPQSSVETIVPKVSKSFSESIALNDKFIFVRELFGNQFAEYELGLRQLDAQCSFDAAEKYCKDVLWNKFNWSEKGQAAQRFMDLLQKRYQ